MSPEQPHNYDLEPADDDAAKADQPPAKARYVGIPRPSEVQPINLEEPPDTPPAAGSVKDLDVCPNCGASMRGGDELVCIRCGFDLKTMRQVRTRTGETSEPPSEEVLAEDQREALIKPGNGDYWLPGVLGGVSVLVLLVAYLAGLPALFPEIRAATEPTHTVVITFGDRVLGLLQMFVLVIMLTACGMGALAFFAHLQGLRLAKTIDDLKLGAVRMLAIMLTTRLATLIVLPYLALERTVEAVVQLVLFAGLSIALFRLQPRDAPTLAITFGLIFIVLWVFAHAVVWATM